MSTNAKSSVVKKIARLLGDVLIILLPKKARQLSENRITLIHKNKAKLNIVERLMRYALVQKLEKIEDHNTIAEKNREFWVKNDAIELFKEREDTFKTDFLPNCTFLFDMLKKELSNQSEQFHTIVEIGTGNGDVLNYLSIEFPQINRFVGIDLSPDQIDLNKIRFKENKKLEFVARDAVDWVKENGQSNTIFVSSRGVLEYFLEQGLQDFLNDINQLGKIFFVAIEPNAADHDFKTQPKTQLYGHEPSFSHNYPHLFKSAGFGFWHSSQVPFLDSGSTRTFIGAKNL